MNVRRLSAFNIGWAVTELWGVEFWLIPLLSADGLYNSHNSRMAVINERKILVSLKHDVTVHIEAKSHVSNCRHYSVTLHCTYNCQDKLINPLRPTWTLCSLMFLQCSSMQNAVITFICVIYSPRKIDHKLQLSHIHYVCISNVKRNTNTNTINLQLFSKFHPEINDQYRLSETFS